MLLPLLAHLEAELVASIDKVEICKPLAEALLAGMVKRFDSEFTKDDYHIASFLTPRFKDSWVFSPEKKDYIWGKIRAQLPNDSGSSSTRQTRGERSKDPLDKFFPLGESSKNANDYLEAYKSAPKGNLDQLKQYPPLVNLFIKYNTPLCSSGSVERLFRDEISVAFEGLDSTGFLSPV